jgi:arylsulfatase A-like enzyme
VGADDEVSETTKPSSSAGLSRRKFIGTTAAAAGIVVAGSGFTFPASRASTRTSGKPNILVILVDEMRFPKIFPAGISTPDEFIKTFMPNTYRLWDKGVKFSRHHSAANDCSPSRGVLMTGLYSQQTWFTKTLLNGPDSKISESPALNPMFPTYGKLLREAGYQTPYVGKWHCSVPHADPSDPSAGVLEAYGFDGKTDPDPVGWNLQGTYGGPGDFYNDADIAAQAVDWLRTNKNLKQPWCLTVSFVNPHDKEFFPSGTEFETYAELFANPATNPPLASNGGNPLKEMRDWSTSPSAEAVSWATNALRTPRDYGYPDLPPNWESAAQLLANKPSYQTCAKALMAVAWGGVSEDPNATTFTLQQYPAHPKYGASPYGIGLAPYSYWKKSLDCYTQLMEFVDQHVGRVVDALPDDVRSNTIIIFTSDHGDYASAHGMVSGKRGTFYDEAVRVPLIVVDPSGRYARNPEVMRTGVTSHVDLLRLLVTIGNGGSTNWLRGDLGTMYGGRHDMLAMLRSPEAPGRAYALHTCDEDASPALNYLQAPWHVSGMVTRKGKLGVYSNWQGNTVKIDTNGQEFEYYNYATEEGRLELANTASSAAAIAARRIMAKQLTPQELRAPLPGVYRKAAALSRFLLEDFLALQEAKTEFEYRRR